MKFLKTHAGAMLVATVIIVLSVLFGAHRSLTELRADVEGSFVSIQASLNDRLNIAANLLSVAGHYVPQTSPAMEHVIGTAEALNFAESPMEKHAQNEMLTRMAEQLMAELEATDLSAKDADYIEGFRVDLAAINDIISRDGYNERVDVFNYKVLRVFPTNFLKLAVFVRDAEPYR